jgi:hypothetical protein
MQSDRGLTDDSLLPPDGTIIRVSDWRRQALWAATAIFASFAASLVVYTIQVQEPAILLGALGYGCGAALFGRGALQGVILEPDGIKARGTLRTYQWRWDEIEHFELRERGETPRFRVHLRNGTTKGFLGFFSRTAEQESKARMMLKALDERLKVEQERRLAEPLKLAEDRD